MKCEKCGCNLPYVRVNEFQRDGTDIFWDLPISEAKQDAAVVETNPNWCGYELTEEEMLDTIQCPKCKQFPFENTEIQVYDIVRIVMFRRADNGDPSL